MASKQIDKTSNRSSKGQGAKHSSPAAPELSLVPATAVSPGKLPLKPEGDKKLPWEESFPEDFVPTSDRILLAQAQGTEGVSSSATTAAEAGAEAGASGTGAAGAEAGAGGAAGAGAGAAGAAAIGASISLPMVCLLYTSDAADE